MEAPCALPLVGFEVTRMAVLRGPPRTSAAPNLEYSSPRQRRITDLRRAGLIWLLKDRDSSTEEISYSTKG